ncbi:alanine racemase [Streptomyces thermolilacinus]|uniref:Diaminopimelate decarboxylase n=1 Tax=Streptomyces thermolilacinus SPC6 TaxID=1306406 RepID=A0A1D3DN96_9ACTN|nr:alanine racemase [Streptomyces thermolilacinus]OEJ93793.1 diaminopimelate decarboxylase [Streptomyces thermolilacinus SPC6]
MSEPLYLAPRLEPRLAALLDSPAFLHPLVTALGSPLNLVLPDQIADNVRGFRDVYGRHRLGGRILYAHKANRSSALVRRLAATGPATAVGIDVASLGELQHALGGGLTPDRIVATGPKDPDFLWLAARTGVTVAVDSPAELTALAALVERFRLPRVPVLPRLAEFTAPGTRVLTRRSRFGTPADDADALLDLVEKHRESMEFTGVSYHLDTMGLAEKAVALEGCLRVLDEARRRGLRPRAVDIGGGYGVDYLADGAQWERYTTELTRALLGKRPPITWEGHGYGLRGENGTLRGALGVYPSHRPVAGPRYLDELLTQTAPSLGRPLATLLLENLYDLHTEPGRALTDQCGLTLARVVEVRVTRDGERLVRLAANARDIGLEDHGLLLDPVLVPPARETSAPGGQQPVGVYLLGNLCLESDLISRRLVFLEREPRPGDLLAFANTAGYFMDFTADHALHQPIARKVAVYQDSGGTGPWQWCLDEQYWPHLTAGDDE